MDYLLESSLYLQNNLLLISHRKANAMDKRKPFL